MHEVAKISATLLRDSATFAAVPERLGAESALVKATAEAYELLELAAYARLHLKLSDSYEKGLAEYVN